MRKGVINSAQQTISVFVDLWVFWHEARFLAENIKELFVCIIQTNNVSVYVFT